MKRRALTILGWIISAALLGSLAAHLDLRATAKGFAHASWPILLAAAALNLVVVALKSLRWKWLLGPAARCRLAETLEITMIDFAANNVLPARGGDLLRIYLVGKHHGVSKAVLASVTGLDKLFDGMAVLLLFCALSFQSTFPEWVQRGTLIVTGVMAVSLVISVLLLLHHRRLQGRSATAAGWLSRLANQLGAGMVALARKRLIISTLVLSIAICLLQVETIRLCQIAYGEHLALWVPAIIFVAINLAIIVPAAPSSVGPFEVAAVLAYTWLHIDAERAFNIAFSYHLVQFIPVTAIGLALYFRLISKDRSNTRPWQPETE
jgi:glycosyltransferase 2 family protein